LSGLGENDGTTYNNAYYASFLVENPSITLYDTDGHEHIVPLTLKQQSGGYIFDFEGAVPCDAVFDNHSFSSENITNATTTYLVNQHIDLTASPVIWTITNRVYRKMVISKIFEGMTYSEVENALLPAAQRYIQYVKPSGSGNTVELLDPLISSNPHFLWLVYVKNEDYPNSFTESTLITERIASGTYNKVVSPLTFEYQGEIIYGYEITNTKGCEIYVKKSRVGWGGNFSSILKSSPSIKIKNSSNVSVDIPLQLEEQLTEDTIILKGSIDCDDIPAVLDNTTFVSENIMNVGNDVYSAIVRNESVVYQDKIGYDIINIKDFVPGDPICTTVVEVEMRIANNQFNDVPTQTVIENIVKYCLKDFSRDGSSISLNTSCGTKTFDLDDIIISCDLDTSNTGNWYDIRVSLGLIENCCGFYLPSNPVDTNFLNANGLALFDLDGFDLTSTPVSSSVPINILLIDFVSKWNVVFPPSGMTPPSPSAMSMSASFGSQSEPPQEEECDMGAEYEIKEVGTKTNYHKAVNYLNIDMTPISYTIINNGFTLSYHLLAQQWISWHSYMPNFYIHDNKTFYSFKQGVLGLWKHNIPHKFQTFYGIVYPFIIDIVSLADKGLITSVWEYFNFLVEVQKYDSSSQEYVDVNEKFFDRIIAYNSRQCSGELNIVVKDVNLGANYLQQQILGTTPNTITVDRNERNWSINELRDNRVDYTIPMWIKDLNQLQTQYYIDKILNSPSINFNKNWMEKESFRDKYLEFRLFFDNFVATTIGSTPEDFKILVNFIIDVEKRSYR
jgi:Holliday junction resolvase